MMPFLPPKYSVLKVNVSTGQNWHEIAAVLVLHASLVTQLQFISGSLARYFQLLFFR